MTLIERMSALFFVQFSQNYFIVAIPLAIGRFPIYFVTYFRRKYRGFC